MSLKSVHTTKCDNCEKEVILERFYANWENYDDPVHDRSHHWKWLQPRGWSVPNYKGECKNFCSRECERLWLVRNAPEELPRFDTRLVMV